MRGEIFLLDRQRRLVPLEESTYDSEDLLQALLADFPDLLAGDQIDPDHPRRWLLIHREVSVPDKEYGGSRWSVDHLFVDQEAIPTLVEVKRSSDTRIRREVVGQLLEYAANAISYWPMEKIQAEFEARCGATGKLPETALAEFLGPEQGEEEFWNRVETHLRLGRVRLLFVADVISTELQQIVEYLNRQMQETEVLAVEIRQYEGEGRKTLVPRVLGRQVITGGDPPPKRKSPWDESSLLAKLQSEDQEIARRLIDWAKGHGFGMEGGYGTYYATLYFMMEIEGEPAAPLYLYEGYTAPVLHFWLGKMGPRFQKLEKRMEFTSKLNQVPGADVSPEKSYPSMSLDLLRDAESEAILIEGLEWLVQELSVSRESR